MAWLAAPMVLRNRLPRFTHLRNWLNLIGDIIVWFVIALAVVLVISKFKKTSKT